MMYFIHFCRFVDLLERNELFFDVIVLLYNFYSIWSHNGCEFCELTLQFLKGSPNRNKEFLKRKRSSTQKLPDQITTYHSIK